MRPREESPGDPEDYAPTSTGQRREAVHRPREIHIRGTSKSLMHRVNGDAEPSEFGSGFLEQGLIDQRLGAVWICDDLWHPARDPDKSLLARQRRVVRAKHAQCL